MKYFIITLIGNALFCFIPLIQEHWCNISNKDSATCVIKKEYVPIDTTYPIPITDSVQISIIGDAIMQNTSDLQEVQKYFNIEDADFFHLEKYIVIKCMLVGPSGWASNFLHYFIVDTVQQKYIYFASLSNNVRNIYLTDDLIINSIEYPDLFFSDSEFSDHFFEEESNTFKLISRVIATDSFNDISKKEIIKTLKWNEVYEYSIPQIQ